MDVTAINQTLAVNKTTGDDKKLKQACKDFEAVLLNSMFQAMRNTLSKEDIFGESIGRDIYESMYYEELANHMAINGKGLGISDMLYRQLTNKTR